jgi:hypothetical protein
MREGGYVSASRPRAEVAAQIETAYGGRRRDQARIKILQPLWDLMVERKESLNVFTTFRPVCGGKV